MGPDRHQLKLAGGIVYYGLVLVGLRARSTSLFRMSHACVRRIAFGAPNRDKIINSLIALSRGHEPQCLDYFLDESTRLTLKHAVEQGPD